MSTNKLELLNDKGRIMHIFKNGNSTICVVLKVRFPTKQIIGYINCVEGIDEYTDVLKTMDFGMKLSKSEALGFFPEQTENIVKHYFTK